MYFSRKGKPLIESLYVYLLINTLHLYGTSRTDVTAKARARPQSLQ